MHFAHEGRLGDWVVDEPLVLGHESGGVIVGVGAGVDPARIGRRVSVEPQHPDTTSAETLRGAYNLDPGMRFYAVPGTDGAFQQYVTIQSHFAFDVPDSVSDAAAALMEPLSVAIAAARKAHLSPGDRVLISGAGPIGIVCTQVARAFGATEITVTDVPPSASRRRARSARTARSIRPRRTSPRRSAASTPTSTPRAPHRPSSPASGRCAPADASSSSAWASTS